MVFILGAGLVGFLLLSASSGDRRCGDSPPYLQEDAAICFTEGYSGPMNSENLAPFLGLTMAEATVLAAESGWTVVVRVRYDADPDDPADQLAPISDEERFDRFTVALDDDVIVRIWPG